MTKQELQVQIEVLQRDIENLTRTLEEANEEIQNIREQVCEEIKREIANLENMKEKMLTEKEKLYLQNIVKPFKDKNVTIAKEGFYDDYYINITIDGFIVGLPFFKKNEYYNNMELWKKYTIKELGLL